MVIGCQWASWLRFNPDKTEVLAANRRADLGVGVQPASLTDLGFPPVSSGNAVICEKHSLISAAITRYRNNHFSTETLPAPEA